MQDVFSQSHGHYCPKDKQRLLLVPPRVVTDITEDTADVYFVLVSLSGGFLEFPLGESIRSSLQVAQQGLQFGIYCLVCSDPPPSFLHCVGMASQCDLRGVCFG